MCKFPEFRLKRSDDSFVHLLPSSIQIGTKTTVELVLTEIVELIVCLFQKRIRELFRPGMVLMPGDGGTHLIPVSTCRPETYSVC